jgi:guanidinobutyrase
MSSRALFERFRASTPQDIEAMIDAMITVVEESRYRPGTAAASIPLDTTVQNFNGLKAKRPANPDPKREPGPIYLSRYVSGRAAGIPTFASAPVALTPAGLRAGKWTSPWSVRRSTWAPASAARGAAR